MEWWLLSVIHGSKRAWRVIVLLDLSTFDKESFSTAFTGQKRPSSNPRNDGSYKDALHRLSDVAGCSWNPFLCNNIHLLVLKTISLHNNYRFAFANEVISLNFVIIMQVIPLGVQYGRLFSILQHGAVIKAPSDILHWDRLCNALVLLPPHGVHVISTMCNVTQEPI